MPMIFRIDYAGTNLSEEVVKNVIASLLLRFPQAEIFSYPDEEDPAVWCFSLFVKTIIPPAATECKNIVKAYPIDFLDIEKDPDAQFSGGMLYNMRSLHSIGGAVDGFPSRIFGERIE